MHYSTVTSGVETQVDQHTTYEETRQAYTKQDACNLQCSHTLQYTGFSKMMLSVQLALLAATCNAMG